jgi:hypothetical protein
LRIDRLRRQLCARRKSDARHAQHRRTGAARALNVPLTGSSPGPGSLGQLLLEEFKNKVGINITPIRIFRLSSSKAIPKSVARWGALAKSVKLTVE